MGAAVMVTARPPGPAAKLSHSQSAIAAANIRVLRQRNGWTLAHLGHLMGWTAASTVCAAEGHRGGRQRRFAHWEIGQLAAIFGTTPAQLLTRCATCAGQPPPGYACLACKAEITVEAAQQLGLTEGSNVTAVIKASDVILATGD